MISKNIIRDVLFVHTLLLLFIIPTSAQVLRMSSWFPPQHSLMIEGFIPWTKEIERVTQGRVKVRILKKVVGSLASQFDVVTSGQVHIGFGNQSNTYGRFKQYAFVELPGSSDSAEVTSVAYWRVYNQFFKKNDELGEAKLLALFTHGPGQLFMADAHINSIEDNSGIKVRGGGEAATRVVDSLGMTLIQAPFSKTAEMISNGVVDGVMLERSIVSAYGFQKYLGHRFSVKGGLFNVSYFVIMNRTAWNSLSIEDQIAIEAISGEALSRTMGKLWDRAGKAADIVLKKTGVKTILISDKVQQQLSYDFVRYEQDWINTMIDQNIDSKAVIDAYHSEINKLELIIKTDF